MKKLLPLIVVGVLLAVCPLFAAITDSFTGANGTALIGTTPGWDLAEGASSWEIQTNKASPVSSAGISALSRNEAAFPNDQYAQAVFKTGDGSDNYAFVAVRMTTNTYYFVKLFDVAGGGTAQIYKRSSGGAPQFLAGAAHGIADNTDCTVKLVITGNGLEVFVNTVSKSTYTDSSSPITSGRPGFGGSYDGVSTKRVIDDFESTSASGGSTSHAGALFGAGHF